MTSELAALLREAKSLARRYRELTGRPLGIAGEIGEQEAILRLRLEPAPVRQAGYDATRTVGKRCHCLQIKTRVLLPSAKPGQRIGRIDLSKPWDSVVLVILNENFEATAMYEADRRAVEKALSAPGSKARNERGALGVAKFKAIGREVWPEAARRDD